jgi:hypothetical protein
MQGRDAVIMITAGRVSMPSGRASDRHFFRWESTDSRMVPKSHPLAVETNCEVPVCNTQGMVKFDAGPLTHLDLSMCNVQPGDFFSVSHTSTENWHPEWPAGHCYEYPSWYVVARYLLRLHPFLSGVEITATLRGWFPAQDHSAKVITHVGWKRYGGWLWIPHKLKNCVVTACWNRQSACYP